MLRGLNRLWFVVFALVAFSILKMLVRPDSPDGNRCTNLGLVYSEGSLLRTSDGGVVRCHSGHWIAAPSQK
jgi:hypothetical protein